jgi:hypothetical protein
MATLDLHVDTDTHECTASINGTPVSLNLDSVSVYNFGSDERPRFSFTVNTCNFAGDTCVRTMVSADRKTADSIPSPLAADLYETPVSASRVAGDLSAWYGGRAD